MTEQTRDRFIGATCGMLAIFCLASIADITVKGETVPLKRLNAEQSDTIKILQQALKRARHETPRFICKEQTKNEWFVLYKFRNAYFWQSSLNIDPILNDVLLYCDYERVDIPFTVRTLWRESRIGTNQAHKRNYDGSIDGGWFGLNSKYHPAYRLGDPMNQTRLFIGHCEKFVFPYERDKWNILYLYGDKKAKELGLL